MTDTALAIEKDAALQLFRTMVRIRAFETRVQALYTAGEIPGFVHLSIGQEASAAGVCAALRRSDYITSTHRGHGHTIAKGASMDAMMAELFGREEGICHGRGGSMHIADFSVGMLGANAIVAGGLSIAVGAGLSSALLSRDTVTVCFFSDGAVARGPFHESLNLASVWRLPVVFACENNGWASTTRTEEALAEPSVAAHAASYAMPAVTVDGNDAFAVLAATSKAVARARSGGGPFLLELRTYRLSGHYVGDPLKYRGAADLAAWKERDPIEVTARALATRDWLSDDARSATFAEAEREVDQAVDFARRGSEPLAATVGRDLFTDDVRPRR